MKEIDALSTPSLRDEFQASNEKLWQDVLDVASGIRRELKILDRTIHSPNNGRGYRGMPHNPKGIAWAIKQYKGFGGKFVPQGDKKALKRAEFLEFAASIPVPETTLLAYAGPIQNEETVVTASASERRLFRLKCGSIEVTTGPDQEMEKMASDGIVRLVKESGDVRYWDYIKTASGLKAELLSRVHAISEASKEYPIEGEFYLKPEHIKMIQDLAQWFGSNFRVESSAKTPRALKMVKEGAVRFLDYLRNIGTMGSKFFSSRTIDLETNSIWERLKDELDQLIEGFTSEGDASKGKAEKVVEIKGQFAAYFNKADMSEKSFKAMVDRLEQLFHSLKGFHAKALRAGLKVVFVGASIMKVQGKYKQDRDELWVKATPQVLKRTGGSYGSPEYIIVHELGHRFERYSQLPMDFDRNEWQTSRYSYKEGEAFAELFAISHYDLHGPWDQSKVEKFSALMSK